MEATNSAVLVSPSDTSAVLTSLEWDSRKVKPQSLFVAIKGEKVNGNDYIPQALEAGALLVIASQEPSPALIALAEAKGATLLRAKDDDVLDVLQDIARAWRNGLSGKVVGVTGSTGKTTTKDLIAGVVSSVFDTHATAGNRNSEIGLSETLLEATSQHEIIICEMGMQALGEIDKLSKAAQPHIGVITNIGVAHCELVGSRENIARAKAELLLNLPDATGIAVLPGDDSFTPFLRDYAALDQRKISTITYGLSAQNDIRATHIEYDDMGYPSFNVWTPDGSCYSVQLNLQGEHNVLNALAAIAVGIKTGVRMDDIIRALAAVRPAALRQEIVSAPDGCTIINDTYNANPDSMRAALSLLKRLATKGKRVAVLGDMYELGAEEINFHRQIGEYAFLNNVDELITVGTLGKEIANGALAVGMPSERVHVCATVDEALRTIAALKQQASNENDQASKQLIILVKASRGMQLEHVVEGLVNDTTNEDTP